MFTFGEDADRQDYKKVLKKFAEYCRPKKNVVYERHKFWSRSQNEDEPFDRWPKDLRMIAKDCEFEEEDNMVRDKIVFSVYDKKVQERMLRKSDLTLKDAMDLCRAAESSQNQLAEIRKNEAASQVDELRSNMNTDGAKHIKCHSCGRFGHLSRNCQSKGPSSENQVQCYNCNGFGHMSKDCPSGDSYARRSRRRPRRGRGGNQSRGHQGLHELEEQDIKQYTQEFSSLSLNPLIIDSLNDPTRKRFVRFRFHDLEQNTSTLAKLKIDSGAEANVITLKEYQEMFPHRVDINGIPAKEYLKESSKKLEAYGGAEVAQLGTVNLPCEYGAKKFMCRFFLCDLEGSMLLGLSTCEALGIVKINVIGEVKEEAVPTKKQDPIVELKEARGNGYIAENIPFSERPPINSKEDLKKMYPECFEQERKHFLDFEYDIKVDQKIPPKVHPPRRVPLELREKLKAKLEEMV